MNKRSLKLAAGVAAAVLSVGLAGVASAQSDLRQALSHVPARMAMAPQGVAASYVDFGVARELGLASPQALGQRPSVNGSETLEALLTNSDQSWLDYTGTDRGDLAGLLTYGAPPATVSVWQFADPAKADAFVKGLPAHGFSRSGGVWRNGEPMRLDLSKRDPKNPFSGPMGRASMIASFAGGVAQSPDPASAAEAGSLDEKASLGALAPVGAALDAIEATASKGVVVQAAVLTPAVWMQGADMGSLLTEQPSADLKQLAARMADKAGHRMAPVSVGAVVADVETKAAGLGAVLALPYPDCDTAKRAGEFFAEGWKNSIDGGGKTPSERLGMPAVATIKREKQACVAVISILAAENGDGNRAFRYVTDSIARRDFTPLQGR